MVNRIQLIGYLGMNPEMRRFGEGNAVMTRMSLATNESFRGSNGNRQKKPNWFTLVAWGKIAISADAALAKGNQVVVNGKVVYRTYTDKTGIRKQCTEVHILAFLKVMPGP